MVRSTCRMVGWHLVLAALLLVPAMSARADVRLPAVVTDNMILQREVNAPVWGWADAGEEVRVSINGQSKSAKPDADGKWVVRLDPMQAGGPYTMTVAGKNSISVKNVLVGEVWVCSGQSNMGMTVARSNNAEAEIAAAKYPQIRLLTVPLLGTQEPQKDFKGQWVECSPETVGNFTAAGYFFGRELYENLKTQAAAAGGKLGGRVLKRRATAGPVQHIPIGLINCSWGGSSCEAWVKRSLFEADPQYKPLLEQWEKTVATYDPAKAEAAFEKQMEKWKADVAKAKAEGKTPPKPLRKPTDPRTGQHRPANLYNGMLLPLIPYAIRGVVWYQGESNAGRAYQYRDLFPKMINNWRADWGQGDFPFYFVQLANYKAVKPEPGDSDWAELREAQTMTLKLPHTGQAVIIDIGEAEDIHPKNKQDVGRRLALWALAKDYGQNVVYSSPMYKACQKQDKQIVVEFDHLGGGLVAKDGPALKGFAIAGEDRKFVWAEAKIEGDKVVVSSPEVPKPVAVRYAWADNPICNLYSKAGLPACPFRTDDWPGITAEKK